MSQNCDNKIKYYRLSLDEKERYDNECETLWECGLKGIDVDKNFHIINGEHIKDISLFNDKDNKKRLKFIRNNDNEIISDTLDVNANDVATTSLIKTTGGPLSELFEKNGLPFPDINENTDIQTLFALLFCQEKWQKPSFVEPYVTTQYNFPELSDLNKNDNIFEVGTSLKIPQIIITDKNIVVETVNGKYENFIYGFSTSNNNSKEGDVPEDILFINNAEPVLDEGKDYKSWIKYNGNIISSDTTNNIIDDNIKLNETSVEILFGKNVIEGIFEGPNYQRRCQKRDEYYACSNLGNTSEEYKIEKLEERNIKSKEIERGYFKEELMGDYKYFIGYFDEVYDDNSPERTKKYTSDSIRNIDKQEENWMSVLNAEYEVVIPEGTRGLYIAIPSILKDTVKIEVSHKELNPSMNIFDSDFKKHTREVDVLCGGEKTEIYEVYTWSFQGGIINPNTFNIRITKIK